jgi:adenylate kinase family enzyme
MLIHLNGPPGIGKSTLARRYVVEHPGVLNCDIDVLRTLVGGWEHDFEGAGELIRTPAMAMIGAYLAHGHDVVLPQMIVRPTELERFRAASRAVDADYVHVMLLDDKPNTVARFFARPVLDAHHAQILQVVEAHGGKALLEGLCDQLQELGNEIARTLVVGTVDGDESLTYQHLCRALATAARQRLMPGGVD